METIENGQTSRRDTLEMILPELSILAKYEAAEHTIALIREELTEQLGAYRDLVNQIEVRLGQPKTIWQKPSIRKARASTPAPAASTSIDSREEIERVYSCLKHSQEPLGAAGIAEATGLDARTAGKLAKELVKLGRATSSGEKRGTRYEAVIS